MDKRMDKIIQDMDNNTLGLDDTFQFKCRVCGKCCKNRHDIILTTRDLHNIARSLGRTLQYVAERYCETYIGHTTRIPIVRLKPCGPEQSCPLLRNRRCIVHSAKPIVCAIFPLGRAIKMEYKEKRAKLPEKIEPVYFYQPDNCGSKDETHTVRSWLEHFGLPVEDEFYSLWTETISILSDTFRKLETLKIPEEQLSIMWNVLYAELYINYDAEKDLIPQFQERTSKLRAFYVKIAAEAERLFGGTEDGT